MALAGSLADHVHKHAPGAQAVELDELHELAGAEIEVFFGKWNDDLMTQKQALKMNRGVALEAALVGMVVASGRDVPEPFFEIGEEAGLVIVYDHGGVWMKRRDENDAVAKAAFLHGRFDPRGDIEHVPRLL